MTASHHVFYRPDLPTLECPYALNQVNRVVVLHWLEDVARQILWRRQHAAHSNPPPSHPWPAKLPEHLRDGSYPEWYRTGVVQWMPYPFLTVVDRLYAARELSAMIRFSANLRMEFETRGIPKEATAGELWVRHGVELEPHDPRYWIEVLLAERAFIADVMDDPEAVDEVVGSIASAVEHGIAKQRRFAAKPEQLPSATATPKH